MCTCASMYCNPLLSTFYPIFSGRCANRISDLSSIHGHFEIKNPLELHFQPNIFFGRDLIFTSPKFNLTHLWTFGVLCVFKKFHIIKNNFSLFEIIVRKFADKWSTTNPFFINKVIEWFLKCIFTLFQNIFLSM